jgi:hypothetical protein
MIRPGVEMAVRPSHAESCANFDFGHCDERRKENDGPQSQDDQNKIGAREMSKYIQADNYHVGICPDCDGIHLALIKDGKDVGQVVMYDDAARKLINELGALLESKTPCPAPKTGSGVTEH